MQEIIKIEQINNIESKILLNIPAEIVDKKFEEFFESLKSKAEVPGFRKGKAPIATLKHLFSKKAKAPVAGGLVSEYYSKAIKDYSLSPIGSPTIIGFDNTNEFPGKFGFDNSYSVELSIETMPKIEPTGYTGLDLEIDLVDDKPLVDKKMTEYREQFATRKQINDRGAVIGDAVVIDFVGAIANIPFDGGAAKGHSIDKLGSGNLIAGFEEQMIGMQVGQNKRIFVTFPQDYHAKNLAGKDATFDATMQGIVEAKPAEIDDDLAMMVGVSSVKELQDKIKEEVSKDVSAMVRQKMDKKILDKLLDLNKFDVPKTLVSAELQNLMAKIKANKLPENIMEQLRQNAEYMVKRTMIIEAIYNKENGLEITPDELSNLLDEHAKANNKTKDEVVSALYNSGQMDRFVGILRYSKVMDFILNNLKKPDVSSAENKGSEA